MTDFPRGWTQSVDVAGGVAASITLPATPGVAHVLDSVTARLVNTSAAVTHQLVQLSSSDGTFNNMVLMRLATPTPAAGSEESDTGSATELGLAAGPGATITVAVSPAAANVLQTLVIQGHDI